MLFVVATKIRNTPLNGAAPATVGCIYEGYLLSEPLVGCGMVLFRDPNGRRMITTNVRRILRTSEDQVVYVETQNSVYRLSMAQHKQAVAAS